MGTGIVSIALADDHQGALSYALLAIAGAVWVVLGLVVVRRVIADRPRIRAESRQPAALTGVAATAVVGVRAVQLDWRTTGIVLLAAALIVWPALTIVLTRRTPRRVGGDWFMLTVATEGLAALAASVAVEAGASWLLVIALAIAALGMILYPLVLTRFDARALLTGRGEQWVAGGSLAISALAFADIAGAGRRLGAPGGAGWIETLALALWIGAIAWLPALVGAELWRPRLRYDLHRWSTVFPLGMYAACSFTVARATHTPWIADFARVWIWIALAAWALTFAGMLHRDALRGVSALLGSNDG